MHLLFLVEMDYYFCFFRRICDMLLPFWLVYFIDRPELRLGCLRSNLLHPLSSPLLHERIVIVEIYVVFSGFLYLLVVPSKLWIVEFVPLDGLIVDFLSSGLLFDCFPVAHFDLDVFPFSGDSACHVFLFLFSKIIF